mmetsp:Transcript_87314/g.227780  ORF Transcript_87314/g.227780 Transcript_87314/m.227780 type:complete len:436 (-) Transcript_87314:256-1563(-)
MQAGGGDMGVGRSARTGCEHGPAHLGATLSGGAAVMRRGPGRLRRASQNGLGGGRLMARPPRRIARCSEQHLRAASATSGQSFLASCCLCTLYSKKKRYGRGRPLHIGRWGAAARRSGRRASGFLQRRLDGAPEARVLEDVRLLHQLPADLLTLGPREAPHEVEYALLPVAGARHAGQEAALGAERAGEGGRVLALRVGDRLADHCARAGLGGGQAHVLLHRAVELATLLAGRVLQQVLEDVVAPGVREELRGIRHQRAQQHAAPLWAALLHQPLEHAATVSMARGLADAAAAPVGSGHKLVQDELGGLGGEHRDALLERVVGIGAPNRLPDAPAQLIGEPHPLLVAGGLAKGSLQRPAARRAPPPRRPPAAHGLPPEVRRRGHGVGRRGLGPVALAARQAPHVGCPWPRRRCGRRAAGGLGAAPHRHPHDHGGW